MSEDLGITASERIFRRDDAGDDALARDGTGQRLPGRRIRA